MVEVADLHPPRIWQYTAYSVLSLAAIIVAVVLRPSSAEYFRRFFGDVNPIAVFVASSVIGAAALWVLQSKFGFVLLMGRASLPGIALSAALATVLALAIVVADFIIRYPQDLNVPLPQALLFYPAIGFVAEVLFHVAPLALLLLLLRPFSGRFGSEGIIWLGIMLVAILEPTFQVKFEGKPFSWGAAYTWLHVFAIAFLQLYVFRRFDFMTMYVFRLFYYAYWHLLWGVIRLDLLF